MRQHEILTTLHETDLEVLEEILDACKIYKLDLLPSEFYEKYMIFPKGSAIPGPARYNDSTPYWKEVVDCFDINHPARDVTIMGPAQMGKSAMVLNAIIIYLISQNPCNILFLTGHSDLTARAMSKLDFAIHQCGLNSLIQPNVIKSGRGGKTGDTAMEKEFRGGNLLAGSITNHNMLRQNDVMVSIADDLDAGKLSKSETGNTVDLIKGRTKAFESKCKRAWVSTPQIKGTSLIEKQFEKSDKRYFNVQCQVCFEPIILNFNIPINDKENAGIVWKLDKLGKIIPKSVEYCCQKCGGHFSEDKKYELLQSGVWIPSCESLERYHYGYSINGLYAPFGMTSWFTIAEKYFLANPVGSARDEASYQTWKNVDMGELYELPSETIDIKELEKNIREYQIGELPNDLSIKDGNGNIVFLTLTADLGGRYIGDSLGSKRDDVRLDWEIIAHTESGSSYSIEHGSIGTFKNAYLGAQSDEREFYSYDLSKPNNVWKPFLEIMKRRYKLHGTTIGIMITGIDTGYADHHVFSFIEKVAHQHKIIGLKGDKENKPVAWGLDRKNWKESQSRSNQFILAVGNLKDQLHSRVFLKWNKGEKQPPGFLNFPQRANGLYESENYFAHFEAEQRKVNEKKGTFMWEKKSTQVQNHVWDLNVYAMALKEIYSHKCFKEIGIDPKEGTWRDFSEWLLGQWGVVSRL